jgi:hypothetical protein
MMICGLAALAFAPRLRACEITPTPWGLPVSNCNL